MSSNTPVASAGHAIGPRVDVIGIGVQKSASSWIFRCMAEHPEIRIATGHRRTKELNFFNHEYEKGYDWYHRGFQFGPWRTLEFSVLYFHDGDAPSRVRRYNPEAKLILSLRNPIDRAYSQHRHEIRCGRLGPGQYDFWSALAQNPTYLDQSRYATHLTRWMDHFDLSRIHVVHFDDVHNRPLGVMRSLFEFVDVDPSFVPSQLHEKVNAGRILRRSRLMRAMRTVSGGIRRGLGTGVHDALKRTGLPSLIRSLNRTEVDEGGIPRLSPAERERLHAVLAEENARLGELLGRDFSHWV